MESLDRNHQEQINKVNATVQHLIAIKIKLSTFFARFYLGQFFSQLLKQSRNLLSQTRFEYEIVNFVVVLSNFVVQSRGKIV